MEQQNKHVFTAQETRNCADNCDWRINPCVAAMLRQCADMLESDATIERIVRDAVQSYNEMFPSAPNDDCERELRERAGLANAWLTAHGFAPEPFMYADKKGQDGQDD